MGIKKMQVIAPKKSDAKKKANEATIKAKAQEAKHTIKKKLNEFGDNDSL